MMTLDVILKRYSNSKNTKWWREVLELIMKRWEKSCRESFNSLPEPPELISASEYGRRNGISHVTAKHRLLAQGYVSIARGIFCNNSNPYLPFLIKTKQPERFIKVVKKLRDIPNDFKPTVGNLKKYLGLRGYRSVSPTGLLGKIRSLTGRHTILTFIPSFLFRNLEKEVSQ